MPDSTSIAIIGITCRFPGAETKEAFWENLVHGREGVTMFTDLELRESGIGEATLADPNFVKASAVLNDVEYFDFETFGYSQKEAAAADPQQRILLESTWHALEDAGYSRRKHDWPVGVYVCAKQPTYLEHLFRSGLDIDESYWPFLAIGNGLDFLATRIAYKLNLSGPTIVAQTACSSSLACVHLACQGLLFGDCDMAIAGSVSVATPQTKGYHFREEGILSPDGHCRAFDLRARGTVPGEGAAVIVLKRLEDAIKDRDHIYAVMRGSAVNNDGANRVGYSGPSPVGQAQVIERALQAAGVSSSAISYVEAHGSGTSVGDAIELSALTQVFGAEGREQPCVLGSVKTNVGHLDSTAGLAGLIKAVLCLKHRRFVPTLHHETPNALLAASDGLFRVTTTAEDWITPPGRQRLAGVSSFGLGGTNCHVILEEAPMQAPPNMATSGASVILLSARTPAALEALTTNLAQALEDGPDIRVQDVALTLNTGRQLFPWRRAVVAMSKTQLCDDLKARCSSSVYTAKANDGSQAASFLISGMGELYPGMGGQLYASEPVFRKNMDACANYLQQRLNLDLREFLWNPCDPKRMGIAHPLQFAINYGLARLWMAKGVTPKSLLGYSLGEYVAATLAGVFQLEDALGIVARRGDLIERLPNGAMVAVGLNADALREVLPASAAIAAENGHEMCVVSGPTNVVEEFCRFLTGRHIAWRKVLVQHAFHSPMMEPIRSELIKEISVVPRCEPRIPIISNVHGGWLAPEQATDPEYWGSHLCSPVLLFRGLKTLCSIESPVLVEVGPSSTLSSIAALALAGEAGGSAFIASSLSSNRESELQTFYGTLARLSLMGIPVEGIESDEHALGRRIPLPVYPFERRRCVIERREFNGRNDREPKNKARAADNPSQVGFRRRALQSAYVAPANDVEHSLVQAWEQFFGVSPIGVQDNFFELGGNSLLAIQLLNSLRKKHGIHLTIRSIFQSPTIRKLAAFLSRHEKERFGMSRFIDAVTRGDTDTQRKLLAEYVSSLVGESLGEDIQDEGELKAEQLERCLPHLVNSVKTDLNLTIYPVEIVTHNSVLRLTAHLQNELGRKLSPAIHHAHTSSLVGALEKAISASDLLLDARPQVRPANNRKIVFVVSTARAGARLLREWLRKHPALLAPPELHLLPFSRWSERQSFQCSSADTTIEDVLSEWFNIGRAPAAGIVADWSNRNASIEEIYGFLQEKCPERLLVDTSPGHGHNAAAMLRADRISATPQFVFLTRHPYSVINSYVEHRLYAVDGNPLAQHGAYAAAEYHWALTNYNLRRFLRTQPASRVHWLKFEDLAGNTHSEMDRLFSFLGLASEEQSVDSRSLKPASLNGNPNGHAHLVADAWKSIRLPTPLGAVASRLAQDFHYELPGN